jgi:hypothetical protein
VEGSVLFVRLTDSAGKIVLDRPFNWPSDQQPVPPGDYTMVIYWRGCNGYCGYLSAESPFCEEEVSVQSRDRLVINVMPSEFVPGSTCSIAQT